ncbi:MAG: ATP-binding protein [Methanobacteriaceae archaeon]|jgi:Cdc6-like AAA superfamily ATPase|nr:ATP-binding protein [Candidatus Methanorudis spinitermitis]
MVFIPLGVPNDIDKYFYNREKELVKLKSFINTLNHDVSNQILLTGFRGVGKSFLLKKLINSLPNNILTAYVDVSNIYALQKGNLTEEEIMNRLLEEMNKSIGNHAPIFKNTYNSVKKLISKIKNHDYDFNEAGSILSIPIPQVKDNYQKLSQFVMEYPQKIVDSSNGKIKGFVIVLDEFQFIGELKSPESFLWLFRSYSQKQDNVTYIFTGSTSATSDMVDKLNGINGAFGNRMIQFNLDPFTEEDCENYLKERISEIKFNKTGLKRFYKCTHGYPAYINSFCNIMSDNVIYGENKVVEEFYNKLDQIAVKWITLWSSLSKQEKEIITTLIDNDQLKWKGLIEKTSFSEGTITKNLKKLKNKGIISNNNSFYKVDDYMLSAWLKHRKNEDLFYPP